MWQRIADFILPHVHHVIRTGERGMLAMILAIIVALFTEAAGLILLVKAGKAAKDAVIWLGQCTLAVVRWLWQWISTNVKFMLVLALVISWLVSGVFLGYMFLYDPIAKQTEFLDAVIDRGHSAASVAYGLGTAAFYGTWQWVFSNRSFMAASISATATARTIHNKETFYQHADTMFHSSGADGSSRGGEEEEEEEEEEESGYNSRMRG